jgi:Frag1/DRAM/Sfk1 family
MVSYSYPASPAFTNNRRLATLITMMVVWNVQGKTHYASMDPEQSIAYISDVGAAGLKPLFITGSVITTIFLDLAFVSERWLRHRGRLARNIAQTEIVLTILSMIFAVVGTAGLILLSIFDTERYPRLHDIVLLLFIAGYLLSAIFLCWEYQRLGIRKCGNSINLIHANACEIIGNTKFYEYRSGLSSSLFWST